MEGNGGQGTWEQAMGGRGFCRAEKIGRSGDGQFGRSGKLGSRDARQ